MQSKPHHHDALGSAVAATDESGNLLWREDYRPYGERIRNPTITGNNLWYTGKPEEAQLGLQYFGARWYDPNMGWFTGIDPAGVNGADIYSFNRYAYANNNPYMYVDPDGEKAISISVDIEFPGFGYAASKVKDYNVNAKADYAVGISYAISFSFPWNDDADYDLGVTDTFSYSGNISKKDNKKGHFRFGVGKMQIGASLSDGDVIGQEGRSQSTTGSAAVIGGNINNSSIGISIGPHGGVSGGTVYNDTEVFSLRRGINRAIESTINDIKKETVDTIRDFVSPLPEIH